MTFIVRKMIVIFRKDTIVKFNKINNTLTSNIFQSYSMKMHKILVVVVDLIWFSIGTEYT